MVVDGKMYTSNEQNYHAQRAKRHKNFEVLGQIMATNDPAEIKKLSKLIREDNQNNNEKEQYMKTMEYGLRAKFSIPALKKELLRTEDKNILEASKVLGHWDKPS